MERNELALFIILMLVFFIGCILLIFKTELCLKASGKLLNIFGLKLGYGEKGLYITRVVGVILLIFGLIAALMQFYR